MKGRAKRRCTDDPVDWRNKDINTLYGLVIDKMTWIYFVKYTCPPDPVEH